MTARHAVAAACPVCGGAGAHAFDAHDRNRETTPERFVYARCTGCGTVFMIDPPEDPGRYYAEDYYQFGPDESPAWTTDPLRMQAASYRVALLRSHTAVGHLIEIGSGTGAFATAAQKAGFDVSAIEMSERCCRYLSERAGVRAICSDRPLKALASLPPARVVALWHVLEHLPDPVEVIARAAEKLEPGGVLAIAVPNPRSLQFRLLRERWAHLDAPRHLCLMPPAVLLGMAEEHGMRGVTLTTTDPDGLECDFFGWVSALRRRPAVGSTPPLVSHAARALCRAVAPLERTGDRGSAVTILMRRDR